MSNKTFYLRIKGQKVEVGEEVYRAYVRPVRNEQRKKKYDKRCLIPKTNNNKTIYVRCKGNCKECEKKRATFNRRIVPLDRMIERGMDFKDYSSHIEEDLIESERAEQVRNSLLRLRGKDRQLIRLIYFEGKTQSEAAKILGWDSPYTSRRLSTVLEKLKKILKIF